MPQSSKESLANRLDDIDIWRIDLDGDRSIVSKSYRILSADEKQKADRFRFTKDRDRYVIARGNLRRILGGYLDLEPDQIRFYYNEYGKPFVADTNSLIRFNVSHSRDIALIAVAWGREVGVDIEFIDYDLDVMTIANGIFSPSELSILEKLTPELRTVSFFKGWTRKEAWLKALGKGFSEPSRQLPDSALTNDAEFSFTINDGQSDHTWSLSSLSTHCDYSAAVAAEGAPARIVFMQSSPAADAILPLTWASSELFI